MYCDSVARADDVSFEMVVPSSCAAVAHRISFVYLLETSKPNQHPIHISIAAMNPTVPGTRNSEVKPT